MKRWANKAEYEKWKAESRARAEREVKKKVKVRAESSKLKTLPVWTKFLVGLVIWLAGSIFLASFIFKYPGPAMFGFMFFFFVFPFAYYEVVKADKTMKVRCPNCSYEGLGKFIIKGSFAIELVLWFIFIIPGLIYSVWRLSNKKWVCPQCDFENVVKLGPLKMS